MKAIDCMIFNSFQWLFSYITMFPSLFFQTVIIYFIGIFNILPLGQVVFQRVHQLKRFFQRTGGHRNNRSHLPSHGDSINNFFIRINRAVNFSSYHKYTTFLIRVNFVLRPVSYYPINLADNRCSHTQVRCLPVLKGSLTVSKYPCKTKNGTIFPLV